MTKKKSSSSSSSSRPRRFLTVRTASGPRSKTKRWGERIAHGVRFAEGKSPMKIRVKRGGWGESLARNVQQAQIAYAAVKPHVDAGLQRYRENRIRDEARRELLEEQQRRMYYAHQMQAMQQQGRIQMVPPGPGMWDRFQKWRNQPKPPAPPPPPGPSKPQDSAWERIRKWRYGPGPQAPPIAGFKKPLVPYRGIGPANRPAGYVAGLEGRKEGLKHVAEQDKNVVAKHIVHSQEGAPVSFELNNLLSAQAIKTLERSADMRRLRPVVDDWIKTAKGIGGKEALRVGRGRVKGMIFDGLMSLLKMYHEHNKVAYGNMQVAVVWTDPTLKKFALEPVISRKSSAVTAHTVEHDTRGVHEILDEVGRWYDEAAKDAPAGLAQPPPVAKNVGAVPLPPSVLAKPPPPLPVVHAAPAAPMKKAETEQDVLAAYGL